MSIHVTCSSDNIRVETTGAQFVAAAWSRKICRWRSVMWLRDNVLISLVLDWEWWWFETDSKWASENSKCMLELSSAQRMTGSLLHSHYSCVIMGVAMRYTSAGEPVSGCRLSMDVLKKQIKHKKGMRKRKQNRCHLQSTTRRRKEQLNSQ